MPSAADIRAERRISTILDLASDKLEPVVAPFGFVPVVMAPENSWWNDVIRFTDRDGVHSVVGIEDADALAVAVTDLLKATDFALDPTTGEANARGVLQLYETIWVHEALNGIEGVGITASVTDEGEVIEAELGGRTARFVMFDGQAQYVVDGGPALSIVAEPHGRDFRELSSAIVEGIFARRTVSPTP